LQWERHKWARNRLAKFEGEDIEMNSLQNGDVYPLVNQAAENEAYAVDEDDVSAINSSDFIAEFGQESNQASQENNPIQADVPMRDPATTVESSGQKVYLSIYLIH